MEIEWNLASFYLNARVVMQVGEGDLDLSGQVARSRYWAEYFFILFIWPV